MKIIKLMAASLLLAGTFMLNACGEKSDSPEPLSELIDFNTVKGRVTRSIYYDYEGNEVRTATDTIYFNYQESINNQTWYGSPTGLLFSKNGPEGLYGYFKPLNEEYLIYKYPASKGERYATKSSQGASFDNESGNPYNTTDYQMLVADTNASFEMTMINGKHNGLMHYIKEKTTQGVSTSISPAEWYILPGKGTLAFIAYYDEDFEKISVYSETIAFP
ncbi:hypothetical protein [Jiulongibacter sediminis]|jgi:hypothetical protein|uniref:hypothetical protein n=1 Tax=Jiulongibacter sediminis TaxID=1605367 RepID=UPI0026EA8A54|nr:hypothetical protein [Jiulongibacter sediminis]